VSSGRTFEHPQGVSAFPFWLAQEWWFVLARSPRQDCIALTLNPWRTFGDITLPRIVSPKKERQILYLFRPPTQTFSFAIKGTFGLENQVDTMAFWNNQLTVIKNSTVIMTQPKSLRTGSGSLTFKKRRPKLPIRDPFEQPANKHFPNPSSRPLLFLHLSAFVPLRT
jgi:hypothetical protein